MSEASVNCDSSVESLVGQVADEFLRRQRQGEQPNIAEYLQRYPQAAHVLGKERCFKGGAREALPLRGAASQTLSQFPPIRRCHHYWYWRDCA